MNACGPCGMCCKLMAIPTLRKPAHAWCPKFVRGKGCGIYDTRPHECAEFMCVYLLADDLPEAWRPDKAKFVVWSGREARRLIVEVDPANPMAWKREPYYAQLRAWADRNVPEPLEVTVRIGERVIVLFPEGEIDLGAAQPRPIESGYELRDGRRTPYARYA